MAKKKAKSKAKAKQSSRSAPPTRMPWSEKDLATLRKMASTRPVGIIAYELGRTEAAVRNKAFQERISFGSPERSPYGKPVAKRKKKRATAKRAASTRGRGKSKR